MRMTSSGAPTFNQPSGARESNAGDKFHIMWAMSRALSLLSPNTALDADDLGTRRVLLGKTPVGCKA